MGRIIKVGDGFLKSTLTHAITNAQYGDTILIDNINHNKETMSLFEIPKGMDIKITSIDSEKKSLSGFRFLIKGNLSISNVTLNSQEKHIVFDIDQGSLELDDISFYKMFSKFHKTAIFNNGGNLIIKNSITLCPYCTNGMVEIENSTIYGGTLSINSKWNIFNCKLYNNYFKYQWSIKENSEINIKHSEVIAYTNLLSDSTASAFLINNSLLYLDNSYFDYNDPSDSKDIYLLEISFSGQAKINNSEVTKIGMGKKAYLEANVLKTSSLATTNNSTTIIEKLNLNNKFNEEMYFRFHYSNGKIEEVISNLSTTNLYLLNSRVTINKYNIPNDFNVFLQDKNSSINSNKEIHIKKLFNDEEPTKKAKSEDQEIKKVIEKNHPKK